MDDDVHVDLASWSCKTHLRRDETHDHELDFEEDRNSWDTEPDDVHGIGTTRNPGVYACARPCARSLRSRRTTHLGTGHDERTDTRVMKFEFHSDEVSHFVELQIRLHHLRIAHLSLCGMLEQPFEARF